MFENLEELEWEKALLKSWMRVRGDNLPRQIVRVRTNRETENDELRPQEFFIGLMDSFSILLLGALVTYLVVDEVSPVVLRDRYDRLAGAQAWTAFLFASYLFGHLVFLLGSWLDECYD